MPALFAAAAAVALAAADGPSRALPYDAIRDPVITGAAAAPGRVRERRGARIRRRRRLILLGPRQRGVRGGDLVRHLRVDERRWGCLGRLGRGTAAGGPHRLPADRGRPALPLRRAGRSRRGHSLRNPGAAPVALPWRRRDAPATGAC